MTLQRLALELFRPGDTAPASGLYAIVDENGAPTDYDPIMLDAGEYFPDLSGLIGADLCFQLCL